MDACDRFRELAWALPDELTPEESDELSRHVETCEGCRNEYDGVGAVRDALAPGEGEHPPGDGVLARVKARLAAAEPAPVADVLTPEELAQMFRVPVDEIYAHLDELPGFEFAGRVRFRRRAIELWMDEQEQRWRHETLTARAKER
jgi:hypothetical protein